ncbi:MAG: nicotinate phosphoribosyltransferase [Planctomycetes bacterium GWF2_41_51]|nr:MAG: nicotinate phosphoribosyltransferase [Planctomycetes bacterium GWF2_41_51]
MIDYTATFTDQYEIVMAQVYFLKGRTGEQAVFDYFFRKNPFDGGYAILAGLDDLLNILEKLRFDEKDISFLQRQNLNPDFINYLKNFKFNGTVYSVCEGDVVFPALPILSIEAGLIEAQLIETIVLNILNFETLIATKASRMKQVAGGRKLVDFGLRRAQGPGGYYASRAAVIGGFDATSNVRAGRDFDIPISGTMAHSFVQSYDDELTAFRDFAQCRADDCILLVDTYDTLNSGIPNAIKAGKEMQMQDKRLKGIRLDSGDLAYLAKRGRKMLDEAGLSYVKIAASNQLDEHVIKSLMEQDAPIDIFGVGTSVMTGAPDAALDGVYKLAFAGGKGRIKFSETVAKITLPYRKQIFRLRDNDDNFWGADAIALSEETNVEKMFHPFEPLKSLHIEGINKEPLLKKVMQNGKRITEPQKLANISQYSQMRLNKLPEEYKRFKNPHIYKIGISERLRDERDKLIKKYKI